MGEKNTERLAIAAGALTTAEGKRAIARAAFLLRGGGTVAFPTETVYGLGANALDAAAVEKIFLAKQRPAWDPLIVHVSDEEMLAAIVQRVDEKARRLMEAFWPGPLTLLLPRTAAVPDAVTAGRSLVGVRMPAHPVAHALIAAAGVPVAAPSANRFGRSSPTAAAHVLEDLDGRIDAVLDAGPTEVGLESTVVDASGEQVVCYRPGAISLSQLERVAGEVRLWRADEKQESAAPESLPSPGLGGKHYAPRARVRLMEVSGAEDAPAKLEQELLRCVAEERTAGVLWPADWEKPGRPAVIFPWGRWERREELAKNLFAGFRELDRAGVEVILCPLPPEDGLGLAIRDRLLKAARG